MVEMHYAEDVVVGEPDGSERIETRHWRIILSSEQAALAQAAQDIAEGRNPIRIVARPRDDPWDYRAEYDERKWETIMPRSRLHERARAIDPAF
jgi:hypothetical protein